MNEKTLFVIAINFENKYLKKFSHDMSNERKVHFS